jgi:hypothetical protein
VDVLVLRKRQSPASHEFLAIGLQIAARSLCARTNPGSLRAFPDKEQTA